MTLMPDNTWEGFPLSFQQDAFCAERVNEKLRTLCLRFDIKGVLDKILLNKALNNIVEKNEILRTHYRTLQSQSENPLMVISETALLHLDEIVLLLETERQSVIASEIAALESGEVVNRDDTINASLLSWEDHHTLLLKVPAIGFDWLSGNLLMQQVAAEYHALTQQMAVGENHVVQYVDFAQWQREEDQKNHVNKGDTYAQTQLANATALNLPLEMKSERTDFSRHSLSLSVEQQSGLMAVADRLGVGQKAVFLACWTAGLWRLCGSPDAVSIRVNMLGRPFAELQHSLGRYSAPVTLNLAPLPTHDFSQLLTQCQDALSRYEPLVQVRSSGLHQISKKVNVAFDFDEAAMAISLAELNWCNQSQPRVDFDTDLMLQVQVGEVLRCTLNVRNGTIPDAGIQAISQAFNASVNALLANARQPLGHFALLNTAQQQQLLQTTVAPVALAASEPWTQVFARQAQETPDAPALRFNDRIWSYGSLDALTSQIANTLVAKGVVPGSTVALRLERSDYLLALIIAVNKAGAAYLPLDIIMPEQRVATLLQQTTPVLLIQDDGSEIDVIGEQATLRLSAVLEAATVYPSSGPEVTIHPDALAYILYTSGTTGNPKGVKVTHRALARYIDGVKTRIGIKGPLVYLSVGPLTTDLGNTTIFPALTSGGCIIMSPHSKAEEAQEQIAFMEITQFDVLKITPSHLASLFALCQEPARLMPEKTLVLGGEMLSWGMWRLFNSFSHGCKIFNHYGPTETCVGVIAGVVETDADVALASTVPLGQPLGHVRAYIVDAYGYLLPDGAVGELYIGGESVSTGYVFAEERDVARFIADPWHDEGCVYRTGDKVRRLPNGRLEFLGRIDRQLKIRGFRVEPAEIEAILRRHAEVLDSCVIEQGESASAYLVAYVVLQDCSVGLQPALRDYLSTQLPDFMLPSYVVALSRFPLNHNGKIDISLLPHPESLHSGDNSHYVAPKSDTEKTVAGIFESLLQVASVGQHDDFFDIGGHSLVATRLVAAIRQQFTIPFNLRSVFMDATVSGLSAQIDTALAQNQEVKSC